MIGEKMAVPAVAQAPTHSRSLLMVAASAPVPDDAYVPILKLKLAELGAIETSPADRLVPLFEVPTPSDAGRKIIRTWSHPDDVIWLHALDFDGDDPATFIADTEALFAELRTHVPAVPVITPGEDAATLAAIGRILTADGRGLVVRIDVEELIDDAPAVVAALAATLTAVGLSAGQVDVVVDAGLLDGTPNVQAAVAEQAVRDLPDLAAWRTVVVAFSGFPTPLSVVVPVSSVRLVPRTDAAAFVAIRRRLIDRPLVYSDYALGTPSYDSVPFTPIPNIRYATDGNWAIHRAATRTSPATQFRALAADIVAAPYFSGPAFSPGDEQVAEVASGASGPGNPMTHLRAGISRHVHVVLDRLAVLGEP